MIPAVCSVLQDHGKHIDNFGSLQTSSYSMKGYAGHRPENDLGVISPTAALTSFIIYAGRNHEIFKTLIQ